MFTSFSASRPVPFILTAAARTTTTTTTTSTTSCRRPKLSLVLRVPHFGHHPRFASSSLSSTGTPSSRIRSSLYFSSLAISMPSMVGEPATVAAVATLVERQALPQQATVVDPDKNDHVKDDHENDDHVHDKVLDIEELHVQALRNKQKSYTDPETGFTVFTELLHLKRGTCCGNQCRHCPYGYENVRHLRNPTAAKVQSGDFDTADQLLQGILNGDEDVLVHLTMRRTTTTSTSLSSTKSSGTAGETSTNGNGNDLNGGTHHVDNASDDDNNDSNRISASRASSSDTTKNVPYTRQGDGGSSQLLTGERRSKVDCNFEALGTVDELCSIVGVAHAQLTEREEQQTDTYGNLPTLLLDVMSRLFDVGSHVAKPKLIEADEGFVSNGIGDGFEAQHIDDLEAWINEMTDEMPELTSFILPTGSTAAAQLHVCRTVCRRAERRVVPLVVDDHTCDPNALRYLNRLSDFFFVAARWVNYCEGQEEIQYRRQTADTTQRERVHRSLN